MSSYLIYACVVKEIIQGLNIVGIAVGMNLVYFYYPQLERDESMMYYKEFNYYFIMKITQELEGRVEKECYKKYAM